MEKPNLDKQIVDFAKSFYLNQKLFSDRQELVDKISTLLKSINPQFQLFLFGSVGSQLVLIFLSSF